MGRRKDFTSAGGTRGFKSGRPFRTSIPKVDVIVVLDNLVDQGVLSQHLGNKTGWKHHDRLFDGIVHTIIYRTTIEEINQTLASLGIFAKSVEGYNED